MNNIPPYTYVYIRYYLPTYIHTYIRVHLYSTGFFLLNYIAIIKLNNVSSFQTKSKKVTTSTNKIHDHHISKQTNE